MDVKLIFVKLWLLLSGQLPNLVFCYSTKGDNVSYLLNSFQEGYDRRLRPNYGGKYLLSFVSFIGFNMFYSDLVNIL